MKTISTSGQSENCTTITKKAYYRFLANIRKSSTILLILFSLYSLSTFGQAGNIDQIRNGPANDPQKLFYNTFPNPTWVNGNAGASNAHYVEGMSIAYRSLLTGLTVGKCYEYVIEYDTYHGAMAIDYLTHYQRLEPHGPFGHPAEVIDPTIFTNGSVEYKIAVTSTNTKSFLAPNASGITSGSTLNISGQPTASFNALPAAEKVMTIFNGVINTLTYDKQDPIAISGNNNTATRVRINFTAGRDSVVLAWGGHIASRLDWGSSTVTGKPLSAAGISGSPYHMRQISMNTCPPLPVNIPIGNQDRSLSAAAVIPPPPCPTVTSVTQCYESKTFNFAISNPVTGVSYTWSFGTNTVGATFQNGTNTGTSVTVIANPGADVQGVDNGGSFTLNIAASQNGITQNCPGVASGTLVDVDVDAQDADNAYTMDLNVSSSQALSIQSISPGTTSDYNYQWKLVSQPSGGSSSFTNLTATGGATFNVLSPYATGLYTVRVIATQKASPFCKDSSDVTIDVSGGVNCGVSGPAPVCPGSQDNVYFYDPNHDGIADVIPANFTVQWSFDGLHPSADFDPTSTLTGTSNSVKVDVAALGSSCNTSYTVKLTLTSTSNITVVSCTKAVSVVDNEPPVITSCPVDKNLECGSSTDPTDTGTPTFTDNCYATASKSDVTVSNCNTTAITRTWTVTDRCGNTATCVQLITLKDTHAPTITCLADGNITVEDNCSAAADIITYFKDGAGVRHWTAIDAAGNTATKDCTLPVITQAKLNSSTATETAVQKTVQPTKAQSKVTPEITSVSDLKVSAVPNPFTNKVTFQFTSPLSGKAVLELYNIIGQKVGVVYEGDVKAGVAKFIEYNAKHANQATLIYKLRVNDKSVNGKLIQIK